MLLPGPALEVAEQAHPQGVDGPAVTRRKPARPAPAQPPPATVAVPVALLDAVRAANPAARDMTDTQVTAGCMALAVKLATAGPVPASIYDRSA